MATVIVQAVASLDGFIARPDDIPGPIVDWYDAGDVALRFNPEHAGDGSVIVSAGEVAGQVVRAGLADELAIDLAPVFLGQGKRFLGSTTDEIVLDDPHVVVRGHRVLHLRYGLRS